MTASNRFLPDDAPPPDPATVTAPPSPDRPTAPARRPNGLDHMGFALQLVQVAPMVASLFSLFVSSIWALRLTTATTLILAWTAATLLSHHRTGRDDQNEQNGR
jgi:hypothetical protein